ncbi:MAG: nucleoside deaminase [Clostridiales bacterium]|nr:nucleoside deaminase [Clostridiales bacterium]
MVFEEIVCSSEDERFMLEAIKEAAAAAAEGEVPVGAVAVRNGEIIARAHNLVETAGRSGAHAEMLLLEEAEQAAGAKWLPDTTVYVTLEPCSMCAGAMVLARIPRLVIGANDPKTGACGSVMNIAANDRLNHRIEVVTGVLEEECSRQLRDFFRKRREENKTLRENVRNADVE